MKLVYSLPSTVSRRFAKVPLLLTGTPSESTLVRVSKRNLLPVLCGTSDKFWKRTLQLQSSVPETAEILMARWLLSTAALLLYLTIRGSYSAVTTTCDTVFRACEKQYTDQTTSILLLNSTNSSDVLCQVAVQTLLCLSLSTCPPSTSPINNEALFRRNVQDTQNKYCGYVETPTTPSPFLPAVPLTSPCVPLGLIPTNTTRPADLAQPNIQSSTATDASCLKGSSKPLLHCSTFGYSHLRAFAASNVQTCLLPGSWYLFKHQLLTVEVSAVADMGIEVPYTRITKINITLFDHTCFRQKSYIATANDSLPQSFFDGSLAAGILQLSDTTTVTFKVPWLNTTIIVRSDRGLLAVSMQAPLDVLAQGQGICIDGCSGHTRLTTPPYVSKWAESCVDASNQALLACVLHSNMFNTFLDISNDSYILVCQFELLVTSSNDTLRFLRAVANDATLLPNTEKFSLPGRMSLSTYLSNIGTSPPFDDTSQTNTAWTSLPTTPPGTETTAYGGMDTLTASSVPLPLPSVPSLTLVVTLILLSR